jgi:hypothetical protein
MCEKEQMLTTPWNQRKARQPTDNNTIAATAFRSVRALTAALFLVFVGDAAEPVAEPVARPGLLLSSFANGVIARPDMTVPPAFSTC